MAKPKSNSKKYLSSIRSASPKRIISFHNSIYDIINKFESSQKAPIHHQTHQHENGMLKTPAPYKKPSKKRSFSNKNDLNNCNVKFFSTIHVDDQLDLKLSTGNLSAIKMLDSISDNVIDNDDNEQCDNDDDVDDDQTDNHAEHVQENNAIETNETYDGIENIDDPIIYEYVPLESEVNERPTRLMRLRNFNIVRCQLNIVQRIIGILLSFPFLSSVNGAGLSTLTCAFFLPRFLCENLLYPVFRLILGTLYPAYASYKAVRNKDVKDYVSIFIVIVYVTLYHWNYQFVYLNALSTAQMDYVLDSFCIFHLLRNIHRHFPVLVPILL